MKQRFLLILIIFSFSFSALAEYVRFGELYAGSAKYFLDNSEFEDSTSAEIGFQLPETGHLSWELWFSRFNVDIPDSSVHQQGKILYQGFVYHLREGNLRPFVTAGIGHRKIAGDGERDIESLLTVGVGLKRYFERNYLLRGEVFAQHNSDAGVRLSIGYSFGQKYIRVPFEKEPEPVPIPEPEPIPEPIPEPSPLDSDFDGVFDNIDQCPDTDIVFKVDLTGCPVMLTEDVSISMDIKFLTNSAELTPESFPAVKELADFLNQFDETQVVIEGHTDSVGRNSYNKELSQRRAETVMRSLIEDYAVSPVRMTSVGYGEEQAIADNSTSDGRSKNRRVVAVVESSITKSATK